MASTYVNDLRLNELGTGDASGTWGTITNTNLELIGEGLSFTTKDCFSSDADATETVADGATDPARGMYFKVTSSATLSATRTLTIAPNTVSRLQFIENATTGSQSINISQGSGANVTIPNGDVKAVYLDGAGSGAAVVDAFTDLNLAGTTTLSVVSTSGDVTSGGSITSTGRVIVDDTTEATSTTDGSLQTDGGLSVAKDIVAGDDVKLLSDSAILSFGADSDTTLTHTDGTGLTLNSTNKLCFGDTGTFIHQSADGVLDLVSDTEVEINGTTIDINGNCDVSGTLNVGGETTLATHLNLGDDDKIKLGDSSDLQIYHDGSNSYVNDTGTGSLIIEGANVQIQDTQQDLIAKFNNAGAVQLYHVDSGTSNVKLATTSAGITVTGTITASGDITAFSDARLKTDIINIDNALSKVMAMQGVNYKRRDIENAKPQIGVIAQDMEAIVPEIVLTADDEMQTKSVDYGKLTAVLIEAIKDLKAEIEELKKG